MKLKKIKYVAFYLISFFVIFIGNQTFAASVENQGKAAIKNKIAQERIANNNKLLKPKDLPFSAPAIKVPAVEVSTVIVPSVTTSPIIKHSCNFPAMQYRKKIAATFFPMTHPEHLGIIDYYDFDKSISTEILKRLSKTDSFLTREANDITLYDDPLQAPFISKKTVTDDTLLSHIASNRDVQYVISGVIRDLSIGLEKKYLKDAPFLPSFNTFWGNQRTADRRNVVIDFFLHDTLTGELLSKKTYAHSISGNDVVPDMAIAFGTKAFYDSKIGKLFSDILDKEVKNIQGLLSCRPFTMRVIDQKEGKLYLDAGISNKVKAGDILTVYIPDIPGETFGVVGKTDQFGSPKTTIKIEKVYPAYSTAVPESGRLSQLDIINGYLLAW
jgi:hypothetical protein